MKLIMRWKVYSFFWIILIALFNGRLSAQTITLESQEAVNDFDSNLQVMTGDLMIQSGALSDPIVDLSPLSHLEEIGGNLDIIGNALLEDISQLRSLRKIGGNLNVQANAKLLYIEGFKSLTSVDGDIIFNSNPISTYVSGFINLESVGGDITIAFNPGLLFINGLVSLDSLGGDLNIWQQPKLTTVNAFTELDQIGNSLRVEYNDQLSSLVGLERLASTGGDFALIGNLSFIDTSPFIALTTIGGNWTIANNTSLSHLDGFTNVKMVGGECRITDNESLVDCCAIKPLLATENAIGGAKLITNNPSACSSAEELLEVCQNVVVTTNHPCIGVANGSIQVQLIDTPAPFTYQLEDQTSGQVITGSSADFLFLIEDLSEGIYDLTVVDGGGARYRVTDISLVNIPGSVFEIISVTTINSSNGLNNGSIKLEIEGGEAPYTVFWSGEDSGGLSDLINSTISIPDLSSGVYEVTVLDNIGQRHTIIINLLDETVPIFPCNAPLDIVVLNDVSSSVDAQEYSESRTFFIDFLRATNIGSGSDDSRAAILEWSGEREQSVQIPITGNLSEIERYSSISRSFSGETDPSSALSYGKDYLASVARPGVDRVLVLATDANNWQISPALVSLADNYKTAGYKIVTIAFDNAFTDPIVRSILQDAASSDLLAPGTDSYAALDQAIAENIAQLHLCPIDPGSAASTFFNRDGSIEIIDVEQESTCPFPGQVEITFQVSALEQLSLPAGTPITFYHNNPAYFGATPILTWQVPCAISAGATEIYTISLPVNSSTHIYAILNDDQNQEGILNFPVTALDESIYTNNTSDTTVCIATEAIVQAFLSTETPVPVCNNLVTYAVNLCNVSVVDATDVGVNHSVGDGFELINRVVNENNCASTTAGNTIDIPAECCAVIYYTYDVSSAPQRNHNNYDVELSGPDGQTYIDFDAAASSADDVLIDGTVDCPSTELNFSQTVNLEETCEDAVLVYTFTIDNQTNLPLQGITFNSALTTPASWVFQPYDPVGVIIEAVNLSGPTVTFIINEVAANTMASFSMNANPGDWSNDGTVDNVAMITNLPDLDNSGQTSLTANSVSTSIKANPEIILSQVVDCGNNAVEVTADLIAGTATDIFWQTTGDGQFSSSSSPIITYELGPEDINKGSVSLSVAVDAFCDEISNTINVTSSSTTEITYSICVGEQIVFDNVSLEAGDRQTFLFEARNGCDSLVNVIVEQLPFSSDTLIFEDCSGRGVVFDEVLIPTGQTASFSYTATSGCDSLVVVKVNDNSVQNFSFVPNVFSPNQDGINDCFSPLWGKEQVIVDYELSIYDRWGSPVFTTTDPLACWDGRLKEQLANVGVYVWLAHIQTETCGEKQLLKGDLLLLR